MIDRVARAIAVLLAIVGTAQATPDLAHVFAEHHDFVPAAVRDLARYRLPPGSDFTHVVTGRYTRGTDVMAGVIILRCDGSTCSGRRVDLGAADSFGLTGVVDLDGDPRALPGQVIAPARIDPLLPPPPTSRWPALVASATARRDGVTRSWLFLISLIETDRGAMAYLDTATERDPRGRGFARSYRLERNPGDRTLDLVAQEQHDSGRCHLRFVRDGRHYRPAPDTAPCAAAGE